MPHGTQHMAHSVWHMEQTRGTWHTAHDTRHVVHGVRHTAHSVAQDTQHMGRDTVHVTGYMDTVRGTRRGAQDTCTQHTHGTWNTAGDTRCTVCGTRHTAQGTQHRAHSTWQWPCARQQGPLRCRLSPLRSVPWIRGRGTAGRAPTRAHQSGGCSGAPGTLPATDTRNAGAAAALGSCHQAGQHGATVRGHGSIQELPVSLPTPH